jgi:hypothetical protein
LLIAGKPCARRLAAIPTLAFRSEFDETVLTREVNEILAIPQHLIFLDLAVLLPSVFPGMQNDSPNRGCLRQCVVVAAARAGLTPRHCHGRRAHQDGWASGADQ